MRIAQALLVAAATLISSCGGGGGGSPAPVTPEPPASGPLIRFEAVYETPLAATSTGRSMTVRPVADSPTISTNPVAKVELSTNNEPPVVLTAANGTDSKGRPQYVFTVPAYAWVWQFRMCGPDLPFRITVTDTTGFSFTKNAGFCPGQAFTVGGFSDYGDRTVRYAVTASQPTNADLIHDGAGGYTDRFVLSDATVFSQALKAREGDGMRAYVGNLGSVPDGITLTARIEAEGGAFSDSVIVTNSLNYSRTEASLICCRPGGTAADATAAMTVRLLFDGIRYGVVTDPRPPVEFDFRYRVTDPATGSVVIEESGTASDYRAYTLDVKIGHQVTLEASPKLAGTVSHVSVVRVENDSALPIDLGLAVTNVVGVPARVNVFCCAR